MAAQDKPVNRQQQAINDYLQALLSDVPDDETMRSTGKAAVSDQSHVLA